MTWNAIDKFGYGEVNFRGHNFYFRQHNIKLGLDDETAQHDLNELRQLLRAWRDAKTTAWREVVNWIVRGALALLLVGIAVRLGATDLFK